MGLEDPELDRDFETVLLVPFPPNGHSEGKLARPMPMPRAVGEWGDVVVGGRRIGWCRITAGGDDVPFPASFPFPSPFPASLVSELKIEIEAELDVEVLEVLELESSELGIPTFFPWSSLASLSSSRSSLL